jgi:NTP pyrophosphatase (non-canonical NTP hydrolase)
MKQSWKDFYTQAQRGENITNTIDNVQRWAKDRNLIGGSTPKAQMLKLCEEMGELAGGIVKNKPLAIKDGIGDCIVVLIILAAQHNLKIEDCLSDAYDEIKDRKGKMFNGIFVKEGDI